MNVREGGVLLMNGDDAGGRAVLQRLRGEDTPFPLGGRRIMTYGLQRGSEWQAADLAPNDRGGVDYKVLRRGQEVCEVSLQLPGGHNVVNSLAALVSASMLTVLRRRGREVADTGIELPFPNTVTDADRNWDEVAGALNECARVLEGFEGVRRRFEIVGEGNGFTVVDDYAHHPTEITAALQAARQRFPGKPVWVVFEPHTYSRLQSFFDDLVLALGEADRVIVTDVYGARESIAGIQSMGGLEGLLADQVRMRCPASTSPRTATSSSASPSNSARSPRRSPSSPWAPAASPPWGPSSCASSEPAPGGAARRGAAGAGGSPPPPPAPP